MTSPAARTPKELLASPLLVDRLEGALLAAAYLVVCHGPEFAPLVERLERELETARREDPVLRAQRILEEYRGRMVAPTPKKQIGAPRATPAPAP